MVCKFDHLLKQPKVAERVDQQPILNNHEKYLVHVVCRGRSIGIEPKWSDVARMKFVNTPDDWVAARIPTRSGQFRVEQRGAVRFAHGVYDHGCAVLHFQLVPMGFLPAVDEIQIGDHMTRIDGNQGFEVRPRRRAADEDEFQVRVERVRWIGAGVDSSARFRAYDQVGLRRVVNPLI